MAEALVLLETQVGRAAFVAHEAERLEGVEFADLVTGPYDVVVRVEAGSPEEVALIVRGKLGSIENVTRAVTCSIVDRS